MKHATKELQEVLEGFHTLKRVLEIKHGACAVDKPSITNAQWLALDVIARAKEASIKDIYSVLGVTSSAATQVVNGLVKMGLVGKKASAKDARVVVVSLTPKTKRMLEEIRARMLQNMSSLFSVLTKEEFETYRALHTKLVHAFDK